MELVYPLEEFAEENGRGGFEYGNRELVVVIDDERAAEAMGLLDVLRAKWHAMDDVGDICLEEYLLAGLLSAHLIQQQ